MSVFKGLSAFPITPTDKRGVVDIDGVNHLVTHLLANGADSIGLLGSTGIYVYLSRLERRRAVRAAAQAMRNRKPLIVGVGALRTDEAVFLARDAEEEGADGVLLSPVSYTPLTEDEVYQHYKTVAEATSLPLCIYNNPTTTNFRFTAIFLQRLAGLPNIAAVKMPPSEKKSIVEDIGVLRSGKCKNLVIGYSGDWIASEALLAGCDGWFSVVAGFLPQLSRAMFDAAVAGHVDVVERYEKALHPMWILFKELGSLRVTYAACDILNLSNSQLPKPLLPLSAENRERVSAAIQRCKDM